MVDPLNKRNLPIPDSENPEHFILTGDSDSTPGANNFFRVLDNHGYRYFKVQRTSKERRPDCYFKVGETILVAAEITDIEPSPYDLQLESSALGKLSPADINEELQPPSTFQRLRTKFKKKAGQFDSEPFRTMPSLLVLYNTAFTPYLNHNFVKPTLYGHNTHNFDRFTVAVEEADMNDGLFADSRQSRITGVVCLDNATDSEDVISFMGRASMRLYLNPHAIKALTPSLFGKAVPTFWFDRQANEIKTNMANEQELWHKTF